MCKSVFLKKQQAGNSRNAKHYTTGLRSTRFIEIRKKNQRCCLVYFIVCPSWQNSSTCKTNKYLGIYQAIYEVLFIVCNVIIVGY